MNKTVLTVGSAVVAGAVSKGITGMFEVLNPVKIVMSLALCAGSAYAASKVTGSDTKATLLQGAYMGITVVQGLETIKAIVSTDAISKRLQADNKFNRFAQKATGLSGMYGMLNGYTDNDGNYHDDSLAGYLAADGDVFAYDELNAPYFNELGEKMDDGLNADFEQEALNADFEQEALNGDFDGELNGEFDDELNGEFDDELNGEFEDEGINAAWEQAVA